VSWRTDFDCHHNPGVSRNRVADLLAQARPRLIELGAEPERGYFICPVCLRRLAESNATQGHYPAEAMKGSPSQTELQCSDCNNAMNLQYEHAAQDFFTRQWDVAFGPKGGGLLQFKAEVVTEDGVLRIRSRGMGDKGKRTLDEIMARAPEPGRVEIHIKEPAEHVAKEHCSPGRSSHGAITLGTPTLPASGHLVL
jgi:hypothetical protein